VRTETSRVRGRASGFGTIFGDLDRPSSLAGLDARGTVVLYTVPPPGEGTTDPRIRAFLAALGPRLPNRLVYIGTTGVYGDCAGAWVTEERPVQPQTGRARRRWDAESALGVWSTLSGVPVTVLRVAGIYGPGRLPVDRLRKGLPVLTEAESPFSNRIHVDDLARACVAAARRSGPSEVFNVSDGRPGTMTGYFRAVADRLGLPRPPEVSKAEAPLALAPSLLSFLEESRRIDAGKMRRDLLPDLLYPDLDAGLASCLSEEKGGGNG
jgi:nucleoside-diphosphate-sugar epimerase